jgi:hypothetical protein
MDYRTYISVIRLVYIRKFCNTLSTCIYSDLAITPLCNSLRGTSSGVVYIGPKNGVFPTCRKSVNIYQRSETHHTYFKAALTRKTECQHLVITLMCGPIVREKIRIQLTHCVKECAHFERNNDNIQSFKHYQITFPRHVTYLEQ